MITASATAPNWSRPNAYPAALGDIEHKVVRLNLDTIGGSALTDTDIDVPEEATEGIPITYVPARNTVFLSIALGWAEVLGPSDIFIGVNAVDYSGYPDCRPAFIGAFETMANLATKAGVEGHPLTIHTPLMKLGKGEIIRPGVALGVDYSANRLLLPGHARRIGLRQAVTAAACGGRALPTPG